MFGKSNKPAQAAPQQDSASRPKLTDIAEIIGGGLVQVIVTDHNPISFSMFLNTLAISEYDVDSLNIDIVAPGDGTGSTIVRATLASYVTNVASQRVLEHRELFPCTIEVIALDRRISISCLRKDSTDGLWINVGLKADGDSHELRGLQEFRFLLSHDLLDARVTWVDGETEDLLPQ